MKLAACFSASARAGALRLRSGQATTDAMLQVQAAATAAAPVVVTGVFGSVGGVVAGDEYADVPSYYASRLTGQRLLLSGTPVTPGTSTRASLQAIVELPFAEATERLACLEGPFAAVLCHPESAVCVVVTDALGMQPLYMVRRPGQLALASEAHALTRAAVADYAMSAAGWGAFLSFGHPIAGYTLADGVRRVDPGVVMSYDAQSDRLTARTHSSWPERLDTRDVTAMLEDEIAAAFVDDVRATAEYHPSATLLLSGGYDSRLVLAALHRLGQRPDVLTQEHADELFDLDSWLALQVARRYGLRAHRLRSDRGYFSSRGFLDHLIASDVAVPSLYLFVAQLHAAMPPSTQAIWEGTFPGCFLYPVHQPPGGFDAYLARESAPTDGIRWQAAARVFHADWVAELRSAFGECLQSERARYTDDEHGVSEFVVRNRTRHRIAINPLQVYARRVLPLTPGLTTRFWRRAAAVPYAAKAKHAFYNRLLERHFPEAARVPVVSGGQVVMLGPAGTWIGAATSARRALSPPRTQRVLQRLGFAVGATYWKPSTLVADAVLEARPGDPDLNAAGVTALQSKQAPFDEISEVARQILFYRQIAQRTFAGLG